MGYRYPVLSLWWLALPVLVVLGVIAARRAGRLGSSALAAACGFGLAFQYLFLINYAAPRFLLPAYALAAIPVADAVGWLVSSVRSELRPPVITLVGVVILVQLLIQAAVLQHQVQEKISFLGDYTRIAADLRALGVRPPCVIKGDQDIPIAFYAGCASAPGVTASGMAVGGSSGEPVAVLAAPGQPPPAYARDWTQHELPGIQSKLLQMSVYLAPGRP